MIAVLSFVTLISLLVPVYVYFGYPLLLYLLTWRKPPVSHYQNDITPTVTLIISCYNEAVVIRAKLNNAIALDYPKDKLDVLVVSDGSDDGTDEIVREYESQGVQLIRQEGRLGKTMGLNLAMEIVTSDIVVFSDANAIYAVDAIRKLVRNFADRSVGYVMGAALYTDAHASAAAGSENIYWRYELAIKSMESRLHSVVGGDGAIYAIRTALWEPLDRRDINDFVNPLQIIAKGYRGVFDREARSYEETAGSYVKELSRKERIVSRSIRGLMRVKEVMNPSQTGIFALEVISHKLLRWLIPFFLALGVIGSILLAPTGEVFFQLVVLATFLLTSLATFAHISNRPDSLSTLLSVPYYFVMVNTHAARGAVSALRGETPVTWKSARSTDSVDETSFSAAGTWWLGAALLATGTSLFLTVIM
jgi:cellulose synthase/poly-beta-1,6-N-acetylglucosamine synthase-like glycosyltransferase